MKTLFLIFVVVFAIALASAGIYLKDYILVVIAVGICIYAGRRSIRNANRSENR